MVTSSIKANLELTQDCIFSLLFDSAFDEFFAFRTDIVFAQKAINFLLTNGGNDLLAFMEIT
jgi:hypothetical protein